MILHLRKDLAVYLYFLSGKAKEESRRIQKEIIKDYFSSENLSPEELLYAPSGKPYFASGKVHFSASHSENLLALSFSTRPCGIDVEKKDRQNIRVAEKYFSKEEKSLPFSYVWTGKEAVSKISGKGIGEIKNIRVEGEKAFLGEKSFSLKELSFRGYEIVIAEEI